MGAGLQWMIAVTVVLLLGGAATVYVRRVLLRQDETRAGIDALAGISWREFIHLVLEALSRRGFERVFDHEIAAGDKDYTLQRDGRRWLLSCKHGSAFVLGNATVDALSDDIRLANASGGFLFTQGRISDEARRTAADRNIELLDGATLWPELRDLLRPERLAEIRAGAERRARQRILLAWLLALLAAIFVYFALPGADPAPIGMSRTPPAAGGAAQARAAGTDASTKADSDDSGVAAAATTSEQQRKAVISAIATLPMVDRAAWQTRSTLQVYLLDTGDDALAGICPLIERYPDLAASRILLTPPAGSDLPSRFRQCRPY